jgi:hypothetical protein
MSIWESMANSRRWLTERILQTNIHLARAHYHYRLHLEGLQYQDPPLIVLQMGKVGSNTIRSSLRAAKLDRPIFNAHFLSEERVRKTEKERRKYFGTNKQPLLNHVWQYQYLRKRITHGLNGHKWKIVTLTREPVGRNISAFFENLDVEPLYVGQQYKIQSDYYGFEVTISLEHIDPLARLFFERFPHDRPLEFLDQEIKAVFGVDVFATAFPKSKGYKIYKAENVDLLLIRLENLNECARDAFDEFLDLQDFALVNKNIGSKKIYAPIYREFRNSVALPDSYIERMYTSRYVQHFYSKEEIARFRTKWRSLGS